MFSCDIAQGPLQYNSLMIVCRHISDHCSVAKIDAVQAEYSAFETIHETDGLIEATRELAVAYVAYSPLGHGWLVDDFNFKSPDDFAADDFRRSCKHFPPRPSMKPKRA